MAKRHEDLWRELCELYAADDGLTTRESGFWAKEKLWIWHLYVTITTNAMVGNPNWPGGINYIDLFAGPGICCDRDSGSRFPGSPLIAANTRKPFGQILLCEKSEENAAALRTRMDQTPAAERYRIFVNDCNEAISDIRAAIPEHSLSIAFIDPTGLHVKLETLKTLSAGRNVDLLILFPDDVDVIRNVEAYYLPTIDSNLDRVLGADSGWQEEYRRLGSCDSAKLRRLFGKIYAKQLKRHAGYRVFDAIQIRGKNRRPLYRLIYASRHRRGLDFFQKAKERTISGQRLLGFD